MRRSDDLMQKAAFICVAAMISSAAAAKPIDIDGPHCAFETTTFDGTFEGGRLTACRERKPGQYTLAIRPETTPINPSPWYAMDIAAAPGSTVTVTLDYGDYRHRYAPDIWTEEAGWRPFEGKVRLKDRGHLATLEVELPPSGKLRLAAQPLILADDTAAWMRAIADGDDAATFRVVGQSGEGRPIFSLETGGDLSDLLLIIGRQHPPETTGAIAMQAFMERLMADDDVARNFRARVGVFSIPMLNPDGVAEGRWRTGSTGKDINRDWASFATVESRLVRDEIEKRRAMGKRLIVGLDFHSTSKDVLYTQPDDESEFGWFARAWHEAINARIEEAMPGAAPMLRDDDFNPDLPTYKGWINRTFGAPGITVEFGDETPPERLRLIGVIAAEELMRLLGSDDAGD